MHYGFTDDENELGHHLARLLTDWSDRAGHREGFDADLWRALAADGWIEALGADTDGVSRAAGVALAEEFGKACPPVPWLIVLGFVAPLLARLPSPTATDLLGQVSSGRLVTAAAAHHAAVTAEATADAGTETVRLTGRLNLVPYAQDADAILTRVTAGPSAASGPAHALVLIDTSTAGVTVTETETVDLRHRYADVVVDRAEALVIATAGAELEAALTTATEQYMLMLSAEALGGLSRLLDDTIRYVTQRRQFGVPIGSFQAVKHLLAHTATTLENGRALTYLAASFADGGEESATADVAAARSYTGRNYLLGAERMIQAHGGFGFTWEAGLHVWYRNAMVNSLFLTGPG